MIVSLARHFLILLAVILSPIYGAWILCGMLADRAGQCRASAMLKGPSRAPAK